MTTKLSSTATATQVVVPPVNVRQVVGCASGGFRFSIPATHLSGVYQVAREQMGANLEMIDTPEGKMPVISAATLLSNELGFDLSASDQERDLIAIRHEGKTMALRVSDVARPVTLEQGEWNNLPKIAVPNDTRGIITAIATVNPAATDPNEAFSLVVDPLVALGFVKNQPQDNPVQESTTTTNTGGIVPQRRGSGQLLAFVPEDVPRRELNFVFSLPLAAVAEVVNAHEAFQSPLNSDLFEGYVMWRKMPVPVVNLATCFGLKEDGQARRKRDRGRRLVIARAKGQNYVAFYTQTQMHSMKTPTSSTVEFKQLAGTPLMGSFKTSFGAMVIPDLDRILKGDF